MWQRSICVNFKKHATQVKPLLLVVKKLTHDQNQAEYILIIIYDFFKYIEALI